MYKINQNSHKRIADVNGIPFETEECTYNGPCQGTCPMCEQELSYLAVALRDKESRGEPLVIDNIVPEDELCRALDERPMDYDWDIQDDYDIITPGIFIKTDERDECDRFVFDLTQSVKECLNLVNDYPDVAIYINPFDHITLVVRQPRLEADALFGFDYCDWKQFVKDNLPNDVAILDYVRHRICNPQPSDDDHVLQGPITAPPLEGEVRVQACNPNRHLTNALMHQLLKTVGKQNIVISPIGIASVLTMLLHATKKKTLISERIYSLLDGFKIEEFDEYKLSGITLEHATSMWYDSSLGLIKKDYVSEIQRIFDTEPHSIDLADSNAVKDCINKWASEHTNGIIKQLDMQISSNALMLLTDALYMKAAWDEPFDEDGTRRRTFYNADGTTSRVDLMHLRTHNAEYERTNNYQAVNLQYSGLDVFMTIVLPHKGKDLAWVMRYCNWRNVAPKDDYDIELRVPRFRFDCKVELSDTLKALGLTELFDSDTAMPEMTDAPTHISQIFQQSAISVTEQGTEATAVTVAEMEVGCIPPEEDPKYHRMTVDRPFGFAIQDINHNVLFMGIVNHLDDVEPKQPSAPARVGKYITSITVAGTSYIKDIETLAEDITIGTELRLKHETDNRHDRNAIGIYIGENRVGYVPRKENQILANLLDAGLDLYAVVTVADWCGNWFDINVNILLSKGE